MADAGEALSDDELAEAFGGDLGVGPTTSAAPPASAAQASAPANSSEATPRAVESAPSWSEFVQGWQIGLYRDPVLAGVFAGVVLGVLGVFVILRRAIFVTSAVSQAAALGVALAFYLELALHVHVPPALGALGLALGATALLAYRVERMSLPREALVGLVYLGASGGAVLVGDRIAQESHDIASILFGTAVLVRPLDLALVLGAGFVTLLAIAAGYRGLLFAGFDPEGARVHGLPVRLLDVVLWVLVALEVSVTTRALGALPVFAFAVAPAMAALALLERLGWALLVAALLGGLAGGLGYLLAFFLAFPVGASQATLALLALVLALALARLLRGSST